MIVFHCDILGRSCQSPSQYEQAGSGITIPKSSVIPQQAEILSRVCIVFQEI